MTPTWAESQLKHQQVESNATVSKDVELILYLFGLNNRSQERFAMIEWYSGVHMFNACQGDYFKRIKWPRSPPSCHRVAYFPILFIVVRMNKSCTDTGHQTPILVDCVRVMWSNENSSCLRAVNKFILWWHLYNNVCAVDSSDYIKNKSCSHCKLHTGTGRTWLLAITRSKCGCKKSSHSL